MLFRLPRSRRDRVLRYLFLLPDPFLIGSQRSEASCHRRHRSERSWASFPFEASSIRRGEVYPKSLNKAQRRRSPTSPVGSKARDGESGVGWVLDQVPRPELPYIWAAGKRGQPKDNTYDSFSTVFVHSTVWKTSRLHQHRRYSR
jgi:hypothetical protein